MNRKTYILLIVASLATALAAGLAGHWYFMMRPAAQTASAQKERKVLYWSDPMVPGFRSDKPGKSPYMDMDLVPVYEDETGTTKAAGADAADVVAMAPEIINRLGVRTQPVTLVTPLRRVVTEGYVFRESGAARVLADVFDRDIDWVRAGLAASVRADTLGGRTWRGRVERVQPDVDIGARTLHASVRIADPEQALKPNWIVQVTIEAPAAPARLLVPREAVIRTGTRTAVILALGEGRFRPVSVETGEDFVQGTEIRAGLQAGDNVVVSGQFLIDSEANLRASFERLSAPPASTPAATPAPPAGGADAQPRH